jgi:alpha-ribazole phosphatase
MDVYLIRHTRSDVASGLCYGRSDVPLSGDFTAQAARLAPLLPGGARVVSAPATRCTALAEHLGAALATKPGIDSRLAELDFGLWEGVPWADIPRVQTDVWARDVWNNAPPGGETYAALHARVEAAWESLLATGPEVAVIVGSIGPLRSLMTIILELPVDSFLRFNVDHGGISKLSDSTGGWRLDYSNRTA